MVQAYLKAAKKQVSREEQKEREERSRLRKLQQKNKKPRVRDWNEEKSEDAEVFEKIARPGDTREIRTKTTRPVREGRVVSIERSRIAVELDGEETSARLSSELAVARTPIAVGDLVDVEDLEGLLRIRSVHPRQTVLSRPDPGQRTRERVLAANVDIAVVVVTAANPPPKTGLIDRFLVALARGDVAACLCINKIDGLDNDADREVVAKATAAYEALRIPVVPTCAVDGRGIEALKAKLVGKTCVFVGHSGVGKSSLVNALFDESIQKTGATRDQDGKGRHTTTSSRLWRLGEIAVIDTPGIREFGLWEVDLQTIRRGFPELEWFESRCSFNNCIHVDEPECAVRNAAQKGEWSLSRYHSYRDLLSSLDET